MRVLNVIHFPVFGGPHNYVLRSATRLADRGWDALTLLPEEPGGAAERLRANGLEVVQIPLHRLRARLDPRLHLGLACGFLPEVQRIRQVIRDRRIDLVKVSGLLNPHAAVAARLEGKPVAWEIIDTRTPALARPPATAVAVRLADSLLFTGLAVAELHGGPSRFRQPWFVFHAPVDTDTFRPDHDRRLRTRQSLGIPADAPVIGTVANLNPQKGLPHLVRAAGRVLAQMDDVWVLVVGATYAHHRALHLQLEAELDRNRVPRERVIFTGAVSDPERYYPAMDVKLITSPPRSEGVPTTVVEALACGVPAVATDVGAMREALDDGHTGIIVPPLDDAALAAATLELLRDRDRRLSMSRLAERTARERFGVNRYVDVLERAFLAAEQHRRQRRPVRGQLVTQVGRAPETAARGSDEGRSGASPGGHARR